MKITDFAIKLEPSLGEDQAITVVLVRRNKCWSAENADGSPRVGLFSGEIALINKIQKDIINEWTGGTVR